MSSAQGSARANTQIQSTGFSIYKFLNVNPKQAVGGTAGVNGFSFFKNAKKKL